MAKVVKDSLDVGNHLQIEQMKLAQRNRELELLKQQYDEAVMINRYNLIDQDTCQTVKKLGMEDLAKVYCNRVVDEKAEISKGEKISAKEIDDFLKSGKKETTIGTTTLKKTPDGKVEVVKKGKKIFNKDWRLGQTSEQYESSGRGPGTINGAQAAAADKGGWSYGKYQIATNTGTMNQYLKTSKYKNELKGLKPGTKEFNRKWEEIAKKDPKGFAEDQHKFIQKTHYEKQIKLLKKNGIDLSNRGPAIQDLVWSTSVQHGGNTNKIKDALKGKDVSQMSNDQIIDAVQDRRIIFYKKEADKDIRKSLLNRGNDERKRLHELNKTE